LTDEDALKKRHQPRIAASTMLLVSRFQGLNSARRAADVTVVVIFDSSTQSRWLFPRHRTTGLWAAWRAG